jgi:hypothetical protein
MQQGMQQGEQSIVLKLLTKKYPKLAPKVAAKIKKMDEETLYSFGEALLFMQSAADCEAWLKANS